MPDHPKGIVRRQFLAGATAAMAGMLTLGFVFGDRSSSDPSDDDLYLQDLMASWWSVPRALEVQGRTFVGGVSPTIYEIPLDPSSEVLDRGGTVVVELGVPHRHPILAAVTEEDPRNWFHQFADDHNTPALILETDRPPLVFSGSRPGSDHLVVRRGTGAPLDLAALGPELHIDLAHLGGAVSYAQPFRTGDDEVIVFCRVGDADTADGYAWALSRSTDWGATWTSDLLMTSVDQCYILLTPDGDDPQRLHGVACGHPNSALRDLSALELDLSTGAVTTGGTLIANLDGTGLPFDINDLHVVRPGLRGTRARVFDVSSSGQIAYASWPKDDFDAATYQVVEPGGEPVTITAAGTRIGYTQTNYLPGMVFDGPDDLWVARNDNAGRWEKIATHASLFQQWRPVGYHWTVEHWQRSGTSWSHVATVAESDTPLVRPVVPRGWSTGPRVLWHHITGDYMTFRLWSGVRIEAHPPID